MTAPGSASARRRSFDVLRRFSVLLILLAIVSVFAVGAPGFLRPSNLLNVGLQTSIIAIVATGMTFVILTGGIDLSVGSMMALSGALAAGLATRQGLPAAAAIAVALLAGAAVGAANGLMVVRGGIPPFVATLATLSIARGLTLVYTEGKPVAGLPPLFLWLGNGRVLGVPVPLLLMALAAVLAWVVLRQTRFGLHVYATGGNEETARLAGVSPRAVKLAVYVLSGVTAAVGGVLLTGRLASAQPNAATGWELDAIAAPVLGGVSLFGGVGGVGGTVVGALIIGVLSNGLNLMRVSSYYQLIIKGAVFVLAVMLDLATQRRR